MTPATITGINRGVIPSIGGLLLVGVVTHEQPNIVSFDVVIDDGTGRAGVRHFDRNAPHEQRFLGRYVQVIGRLSDTVPPRIVAETVQFVAAGAVSFHTIKVTHAALRRNGAKTSVRTMPGMQRPQN